MQPLEANDYFLYDKLSESGDGVSDEERVVDWSENFDPALRRVNAGPPKNFGTRALHRKI